MSRRQPYDAATPFYGEKIRRKNEITDIMAAARMAIDSADDCEDADLIVTISREALNALVSALGKAEGK